MDTQLIDTYISLKFLTMNIQCMEQHPAELFYVHVLYIVCLINNQFLLKILLALNVFFYKYNKGMLI